MRDLIDRKAQLDMSYMLHTFLQKVQYYQKCTYHNDTHECNGGLVNGQTCPSCHGTGQKVHQDAAKLKAFTIVQIISSTVNNCVFVVVDVRSGPQMRSPPGATPSAPTACMRRSSSPRPSSSWRPPRPRTAAGARASSSGSMRNAPGSSTSWDSSAHGPTRPWPSAPGSASGSEPAARDPWPAPSSSIVSAARVAHFLTASVLTPATC